MTNSYVTPADTSVAGYHADGVSAIEQKNYMQAINSFRNAAEQGYAPSQAEMGAAYMLGIGVDEDFYQSRTWLEKAAAQGDADGYFLLGNVYYNGLGVEKDEKTARDWYNKAAALGHPQGLQAAATLNSTEENRLAALRSQGSYSWKDQQRALTHRISAEYKPRPPIKTWMCTYIGEGKERCGYR